jgi:tRNA-specific 2-thiouridylase
LKKAVDQEKDQSYVFIYDDAEGALKDAVPAWGPEKVRDSGYLRRKRDLSTQTSGQPGYLFCQRRRLFRIFAKILGADPAEGEFVDREGNVLGKHGVSFTIRRPAEKGWKNFGKPMYVVRIDSGTNRVTLGPGRDLYTAVLRPGM